MYYDKKIIWPKDEKIYFPYILMIPNEMDDNASLIVDIMTPPAMVGNVDDMVNKLLNSGINYFSAKLMEKLHYPVMIPIIPRPVGFYTIYLGSKNIKNNFERLHGNIPKGDEFKFKNIDLQVYYMIKECTYALNLDSKVIMNGYSAGSKFATGFSILHPDVVCCNLSGGTSGLSTLPIQGLMI